MFSVDIFPFKVYGYSSERVNLYPTPYFIIVAPGVNIFMLLLYQEL